MQCCTFPVEDASLLKLVRCFRLLGKYLRLKSSLHPSASNGLIFSLSHTLAVDLPATPSCTQRQLLYSRAYTLKILPKLLFLPAMYCSYQQVSLLKWHEKYLKAIRLVTYKTCCWDNIQHTSALRRLPIPSSTLRTTLSKQL